ncbi:MAG TPA: hypothetical protein VGR48_15415, partial [Terriglobales bacterium]|nr:hypothetical protein [Terriglobales bacterium]
PWLVNANLQVTVIPSAASRRTDRQQTLESRAEKLRNQLLYFRLTNRHLIKNIENFDNCGLTPQMRHLAEALTAALVDNPEVRQEIVPLLRPQDEHVRAEQIVAVDSNILEALLVFCHEGKQHKLRVNEITDESNNIRIGRGETLLLSPEEVGIALNRRLGLFTKRDGVGKRLILDSDTQALIHELAYRYQVPSAESGEIRCQYCRRGGNTSGTV